MGQHRTNPLVGRAGTCLVMFLIAGCGGGSKGPGGSTDTGGESGGDQTGGATGGGTGTSTGGKSGTGGSMVVDAKAPEGTGGAAGGSSGEDAAPPADSGGGDTGGAGGAGGAPACGMAGQMCCAGNKCGAGAMPAVMPGGEPGGMVVLELHASGGDPYALFGMKDMLPIDGPASGYITDEGDNFKFVLHQDGAEETVSSGAKRQRNELTVNPGNPAMYKGMHGDTMSYSWRFRLDKMNAQPTWCDIFQIKQHGTLGPAPFMALEANKGDLNVDTQRLGVVTKVPLSAILGVWINASVTAKYSETGSLSVMLK